MEKIYFIILNYNTSNETKKCIKSIKELDSDGIQKHVIVIDNFSSDQSFDELKSFYFTDENIEIYQMNENKGFSKANNYAYKLVREKGDAKFCIVCNSDIEFIQRDFLLRIEKEYLESHFYICGPDVYCIMQGGRGRHQSPAYPFECKREYVKAYFQYSEAIYKKLKGEIAIIKSSIQLRWLCWKYFTKFLTIIVYRNFRKKRHEDMPIHGSCIVLSKHFISSERILFWPEVKFYGEERLLYLRMTRNNYKIVFNPEIQVLHLQGKSTASIKDTKQRDIFRFENFSIGARTYLEELDK